MSFPHELLQLFFFNKVFNFSLEITAILGFVADVPVKITLEAGIPPSFVARHFGQSRTKVLGLHNGKNMRQTGVKGDQLLIRNWKLPFANPVGGRQLKCYVMLTVDGLDQCLTEQTNPSLGSSRLHLEWLYRLSPAAHLGVQDTVYETTGAVFPAATP